MLVVGYFLQTIHPLWFWNFGEHLVHLGKVFLVQGQGWLSFSSFPKALQPRTKAVDILCWIELLSPVTSADKLINRGEDKGVEISTTVHFNGCICLFQLRVEELPPHKGILKRLNEAGRKALGSASLSPEVKHKLDTRLKEANHRWIKVRHINNYVVAYICNLLQVLPEFSSSFFLLLSACLPRFICTSSKLEK